MFVKVNMANKSWIKWFLTPPEPCIAFRVELPDGNYSLVSEAEEGGADAELQCVEVSEDTEDPQANPADKGKPQCIKPSVFEILCNYLWMIVNLRSGDEMKP
jgi:hypothetical protein